jgi:methyltransferase (TIGR00027 family)
MKTGETSATAISTARARAAHLTCYAGPKIHEDSFALRLTGDTIEELRRIWRPSIAAQRAAAYFAMRQRFSEERLLVAVERGVRQVVLLGAGLDTFALRHPDIVRTVAYVEVDHPDSQSFKQRRLDAEGLSTPGVTYVPIDFAKQSLASELAAVGIDTAVPTFFAWLGVTQYIPESASLETLSFVASHARDSEVVFTVIRPDDALPADELPIQQYARSGAEAQGEPWITYFEPEELARSLSARGFRRVDDLTVEAASRYFVGQPDGVTPLAGWRLLAAIV